MKSNFVCNFQSCSGKAAKRGRRVPPAVPQRSPAPRAEGAAADHARRTAAYTSGGPGPATGPLPCRRVLSSAPPDGPETSDRTTWILPNTSELEFDSIFKFPPSLQAPTPMKCTCCAPVPGPSLGARSTGCEWDTGDAHTTVCHQILTGANFY